MGRPARTSEPSGDTSDVAMRRITRSVTRKARESEPAEVSPPMPSLAIKSARGRKRIETDTSQTCHERLVREVKELSDEKNALSASSAYFKKQWITEKKERTRLLEKVKKMSGKQNELERTISKMNYTLNGKVSIEVKKRLDLGLKKERDKTTFYRQKMLDMAKRLESEHRGPGREPPAWKLCEICTLEYGEGPGRIPRILKCGHTLCENCVAQIAHGTRRIECPFDRQAMLMPTKSPKSLMKNYTVLSM